jgi:ribosomal protein S18 acetylase RimI-like enzyme
MSKSEDNEMSDLSSRPYQGKADLQFIIELTFKVRPVDHRNDYPAQADLEEDLASNGIQENTRLWFDGSQLVGYAYVDDFRNLRWEIESQYVERLGEEVVEWGEACIRKSLTKSETATLDASCREDYAEKLSFLQKHGFYQTDALTIRMTRALAEAIPEPQLPQGFVIRPTIGMDEAEAIASTHRAAFGTDYMTTEKRLAIMNTSEYDPSLDLVVVAPDGTIAAYCTCSANDVNKTGSTDPVATHPRFQRKGLARALLLTGMKMLKERGMEIACLNTSGDNLAMQKTAESVGFHAGTRTLWFEKTVSTRISGRADAFA